MHAFRLFDVAVDCGHEQHSDAGFRNEMLKTGTCDSLPSLLKWKSPLTYSINVLLSRAYVTTHKVSLGLTYCSQYEVVGLYGLANWYII